MDIEKNIFHSIEEKLTEEEKESLIEHIDNLTDNIQIYKTIDGKLTISRDNVDFIQEITKKILF